MYKQLQLLQQRLCHEQARFAREFAALNASDAPLAPESLRLNQEHVRHTRGPASELAPLNNHDRIQHVTQTHHSEHAEFNNERDSRRASESEQDEERDSGGESEGEGQKAHADCHPEPDRLCNTPDTPTHAFEDMHTTMPREPASDNALQVGTLHDVQHMPTATMADGHAGQGVARHGTASQVEIIWDGQQMPPEKSRVTTTVSTNGGAGTHVVREWDAEKEEGRFLEENGLAVAGGGGPATHLEAVVHGKPGQGSRMIQRSMGYSPLLQHMDHLLLEVAKANEELELKIASATNRTAALAAVNMEVLDHNDSSDDVIEMDLQRFEAGDPRLTQAHELERQVIADPNRVFDEDVRDMFHIPPVLPLVSAPEHSELMPTRKHLQLAPATRLPLAPAEMQHTSAQLASVTMELQSDVDSAHPTPLLPVGAT